MHRESGINSYKVVLICHFNNDVISKILKVSNSQEFAPWIYEFIKLFSDEKKIRLHVISPHSKIYKCKTIRFSNSVTLHFFPNYRLGKVFSRFSQEFNIKSDYFFHRKTIYRICSKIKPDIIHLFGAENPYYSASGLGLSEKYPIVLTIQGIINHVLERSKYISYKKDLEIRLVKKIVHFGVRDSEMINFIENNNSSPIFHYHNIPIKEVKKNNYRIKKYDLIFFARIVKTKGIEDYLLLIKLLREKYKKNIYAAVIGHCEQGYENFLRSIIAQYGLQGCIHWIGRMNNIDDIHGIVVQSRIIVLPTYADTIPGTILEGIQLKIPVISYKVGGIPALNNRRNSILLADKGDVEMLYQHTVTLLENQVFLNKLVNNAHVTFQESWGSSLLKNSILSMYDRVINN
jgi:glycosyltransferase involved in cell wall biosynthesis